MSGRGRREPGLQEGLCPGEWAGPARTGFAGGALPWDLQCGDPCSTCHEEVAAPQNPPAVSSSAGNLDCRLGLKYMSCHAAATTRGPREGLLGWTCTPVDARAPVGLHAVLAPAAHRPGGERSPWQTLVHQVGPTHAASLGLQLTFRPVFLQLLQQHHPPQEGPHGLQEGWGCDPEPLGSITT